MIKFEETTNGFKLFYKDYLFFNHNHDNPCFILGKGAARYRSRHGDFKIREKRESKIPLLNFKLISQSGEKIEIKFHSSGEKLKVTFQVVNNHLEITPESDNNNINRFWIRINANSSEAIYGCGEQFSELNLRGKSPRLWVEEQGIGRGWEKFNVTGDWDTTYYPQPTFVSSENYFCHCESYCHAIFNFTQDDFHELYIWRIPEKIIIGKHDTALETISDLSEYLGRQPELPDWVYNGVWLGIQGGKEIVNKKIEKCLKKEVKVAGVWCQDWQGIRMLGPSKRLFWNWKYDEDLYPDLPSYIQHLNEKGIKFLGYINSMLSKDGEQYKEALKKGYCVKNQEGMDYNIKTDTGEKGLLDLSNPDTIKWLKSIIKENMIKIGLSGWMADYGEYLPTDAFLHSGENAELFHNKYPVIFAKTNLDAIREAGKLNEIVFFTRAGYSKISRYTTMVWAGDQLVNWSKEDGLASVIPAGISLGICGIGYFHFDIGGFHTFNHIKRDKEIFMRWTELATFTMTMRTHEGVRPHDNWQFDSDDECLQHFAKMSRIHVYLKPYLKHLSNEYQKKGIPPIRACYLHYENDPTLHQLKYQYLFGKDLLIAPVIKPGQNKWKVYFPNDTWVHIWSKKEYKKGWNEVKAPIGQPPIFYRKGTKFLELFNQIKKI